MNNIMNQLNSSSMYLVVGIVILFVACVCILFMVRAYKTGLAIGMDKHKLKQAITSSATFSILPSIGILLGVIALSGALGIPLPWLRLSVVGALHYETQVAQAASEAVGLESLSASHMTAQAFTTIALVMSVCIIWGMVLAVLFTKKYTTKKEKKEDGKKSSLAGFGDKAMNAMFVGLVSAYIGSYLGSFISGEGMFSFKGDIIPILVAIVSAITMAFFIYLKEKKHQDWVDSFSIAGSMLVAMASAIIFGMVI